MTRWAYCTPALAAANARAYAARDGGVSGSRAGDGRASDTCPRSSAFVIQRTAARQTRTSGRGPEDDCQRSNVQVKPWNCLRPDRVPSLWIASPGRCRHPLRVTSRMSRRSADFRMLKRVGRWKQRNSQASVCCSPVASLNPAAYRWRAPVFLITIYAWRDAKETVGSQQGESDAGYQNHPHGR